MLKINIQDEVSRLRAVLLGTAKSNGPTAKSHGLLRSKK